jgi:hypothetical protein
MPRPLNPRRRDSVTIVQEAGWAPGPVWRGGDNLAHTEIRPPDLPACSQPPKRLYSWEDKLKTHLKQNGLEYVDWINLDQVADIWWVLMNMVLNFWIPQKVGCIFTKWGTICFAFQQHCSHYAGYCLPQMYLYISLVLCQHSSRPHQTRNVSCTFAQVSFLFHFYLLLEHVHINLYFWNVPLILTIHTLIATGFQTTTYILICLLEMKSILQLSCHHRSATPFSVILLNFESWLTAVYVISRPRTQCRTWQWLYKRAVATTIARLLTAEQTMLLQCVTCYAVLTLAVKNILHYGW